MATIKRIIPPIIHKNGDIEYVSRFSPPDDSIAICYKVPDRIIPVVFVPGVMGSNLMSKESEEPVWVMDAGISDSLNVAAKWGSQGAKERKELLDPAKTQVFRGGKLPDGAEPGIIFTGATQQEKDTELLRRGWGEVAGLSYGDWLKWLEKELNRLEYCFTGVPDGKHRHQVATPPGVPPLLKREGKLAYRYQFPVHAVGYNWLQSNAVSAQHLKARVDAILGFYKKGGYPCDKVILVTHSMGGLVARHYTEVLGGADKVYGVVHGVMPDLGAATTYKRVKAGTEGSGVKGAIVSRVLGDTAAKMTAVLAQASGPLQLLPSAQYGEGWLMIKDGEQLTRLPKRPEKAVDPCDPYGEIYTVRGKWWGLIDDKLINPLDVKKQTIDADWKTYFDLINGPVRNFHEDIKGKYHPHTYAFYGDDTAYKTWGDVVWERKAGLHHNVPITDVQDLKPLWDDGKGSHVLTRPGDPTFPEWQFRIRDAGENGDGTVPVRSGRGPPLNSPRDRVKVCIGYPGIDHEGAYKNEPQRWFAVWAITKILQNVRGTAMDYPDSPPAAAVAPNETTA